VKIACGAAPVRSGARVQPDEPGVHVGGSSLRYAIPRSDDGASRILLHAELQRCAVDSPQWQKEASGAAGYGRRKRVQVLAHPPIQFVRAGASGAQQVDIWEEAPAMRSSITLAAVFTLLVLGTLGCSESPEAPQFTMPDAAGPAAQYVGIPCNDYVQEPTLLAGQFIDAGKVSVYNDENYLYVEISTTGGWELTESHVAVAPSVELIPQTGSGNPKVGQFALAAVHNPPVTSYVYTIGATGYDPAYIAVHTIAQLVQDGRVVQRETAWADGLDFPGANWATYIAYDVQECAEPIYGACCLGADCIVMTEGECQSSGGTYQGDYTSCDENPCEVPPTPMGACCLPDGTCQFVTQGDCAELGGVSWSEGLTCEQGPCPPTGACCVGAICQIMTLAECEFLGGTYQGDYLSCSSIVCGE
jgi:hypothetical protein